MDEKNQKIERIVSHMVTLDNRKKITITGIKEVISATDKSVIAKTQNQKMIISGQDLRVEKLNLEEELLIVIGVIDNFKYCEHTGGKSFFKRVFK